MSSISAEKERHLHKCPWHPLFGWIGEWENMSSLFLTYYLSITTPEPCYKNQAEAVRWNVPTAYRVWGIWKEQLPGNKRCISNRLRMAQNIKNSLIVGVPSQRPVCHPDSVALDRGSLFTVCLFLWELLKFWTGLLGKASRSDSVNKSREYMDIDCTQMLPSWYLAFTKIYQDTPLVCLKYNFCTHVCSQWSAVSQATMPLPPIYHPVCNPFSFC